MKLLIIWFFLLTIGCTHSKVNKRVASLKSSVSDMRSFDSDLEFRLNEIELTLKEIQGKIEVLEHFSNESYVNDIAAIRDSVNNLKRRVPPPTIVPEQALISAESTVNSLPEEVSELVRPALGLIREGSFNEAISNLTRAQELSSGKPFSSEIFYWLGIAYEGLEKNREALMSYNTIINEFNESALVPAAIFRQAGVFLRIGDKQAYSVSLRKLIADYPKSKEAKSISNIINKE